MSAFPTSLLLIVVLAGLPGPLQAQGLFSDTTLALPDITVTATRTGVSYARAPARITLLDSTLIRTSRSHNVGDLLETHSPAFVRRYGLTGLANLSLRGTSPSQTLVMIDGSPITNPQLGSLDLTLLPTLLLQSVEILHGPASSLYGSDGVGGVVDLRTLRSQAPLRLDIQTLYGAFGDRSGSVTAGGRRDRMGFLVAAEHRKIDGDFAYTDHTAFPPRERKREGADLTTSTVFSTLSYAVDGTRLDLSGWYGRAARGLSGPASAQSGKERQWDDSFRLWISGRRAAPGGSLEVRASVQESSLRYRNELVGIDDTGRTRIITAEISGNSAITGRMLVGAGVVSGYGMARHPSLASDPAEIHTGAFVHAFAALGRLGLFPALRLDHYSPVKTDGRTLLSSSPRLGANFQLFDQAPLHLKAGIGRSFRAPTFNERFWQPGGRPDLTPESGWTVDGGMLAGDAGLQVEITAFSSSMRDQIVWLPTRFGHWSPSNVARTVVRGVEMSLRGEVNLAANRRIRGSLMYTLTDARDRSDSGASSFDHQLRYVPRHQAKGSISVSSGPIEVSWTGRFTGRRYVTTDGRQSLDPFLYLDAGASIRTSLENLRIRLFGEIANTLDTEYQVIQQHPMPPRHARAGMILTIL